MNILYITNGVKHPGGLERILSEKTRELIDRYEYNISFVTLNDNERDDFYQFHSQITFFDINFKGNPVVKLISYIRGIRNVVQKMQPDIIVVCDDGLKGFFVPLLLGLRVPIVYERHIALEIVKQDNSLTAFVSAKLMQYLSKKFTKFILLTESHEQDWPDANCLVIPNAMPFEVNEKALLTNKQIIAVGRICEQKAYDRLLEIWSKITLKYPEWTLNIYGKELDGGKTAELVKKLGLDQCVKILEPIDNIQQSYLNSSLIVMTSHYEGLPMVLIEAMSCGLPAIAYDCPYGPRDIIDNGKNGFLIPDDNADEFIDKLSILIENTDLRREFGGNAVNTSLRYSKENIIIEWDCLFQSILDNK